MFINYLTSAIRALFKQKIFAIINIMGLSVGLAASILILLFVRYELSYEDWLPNADEVYRVSSIWKDGGVPQAQAAWVSGRLKQALEDEFIEIDQVTRVAGERMTFKYGEKVFSEVSSRVDPEFFDLFALRYVKGDPTSIRSNPNHIAINETTAEKYFGQSDPIGQTILADEETYFEVVAVFEDLPQNSELDFEILRLFDIPGIKGRHYFDDWNSQTLQTYFTLNGANTVDAINGQFDDFLMRVFPDDTPETPVTDGYGLTALSIKDLHLFATTGDDFAPGGGFRTIVTFATVALLVIMVASFNFVNSSTAIAQLRAKEVAMRKALGATRTQLLKQFMSESAFLVFVAFTVALILVELALPSFREFWDKPISAAYFTDPVLFVGLLLLFPAVVIGAGYYPAVYLTKFRPSKTLMSNRSNSAANGGLRNILVLLQFAIAIALAIVATIIHMQFEFATTKELGFDRENKLILRGIGDDKIASRYDALRQELERIPGVAAVSRHHYVIGDGNNMGRGVEVDWVKDRNLGVRIAPIGFGYFDLYGMELIAGRDFDRAYANDIFIPAESENDDEMVTVPGNVIINESALRELEIPDAQAAIGRVVNIGFGYGSGRGAMTIIGVVKNFKSRNVREPVQPEAFFVQENYLYNGTVSLKPGSLPDVMDEIERVWKSINPEVPMRHQFLDAKLENMYAPTLRRSQMLYAFSMLAIIISAMGLYGLASFSAIRRMKEVGIRKVMGASSARITLLMIRQFSMPIILANIIAWPVAWYFTNDWLSSYAYRIDMDFLVYALFGGGALLLAWLTVGGHAWKVSRSNPIKALRYE